jgi:hypothetical protein
MLPEEGTGAGAARAWGSWGRGLAWRSWMLCCDSSKSKGAGQLWDWGGVELPGLGTGAE